MPTRFLLMRASSGGPVLCALLILTMATSPVFARMHETSTHAQPLTLAKAVAKVRKETGGKVLAAHIRRHGHTIEYRIKELEPNGHVRVVSVLAEVSNTATDGEKH